MMIFKGTTIHHYNWLAVLWEQLHFSAYKKHRSQMIMIFKGATIHHYNWLAVLWEQLHFSAYKKHKSNSLCYEAHQILWQVSISHSLHHTLFPDFPGFFTLSNITHNTTFKCVKMLLWAYGLVCT